MINKFKNVLVIAPHPDDAELGVGGTISKLLRIGAKVHCVVVAHNKIRDYEFVNAAKRLGLESWELLGFQDTYLDRSRQGILDRFREIKEKIKPDLVLCPSENDLHQDHSTVGKEALREFKNITLMTYDNPWKFFKFQPNVFIQLEKEDIKNKLESVKEYKSIKNKIYCNPERIEAWAKFRGSQVEMEYAEAFELKHLIL